MTYREFNIHGEPRPQGDKSAVMTARGMRVIEANSTGAREKHKNWRAAVADAAAQQVESHGAMPSEPLVVMVIFRFPMPKSRSKSRRSAGWGDKSTKPDIDKLLRALFDGLVSGGLIDDDCRISWVVASKIEVVTPSWLGCSLRLETLESAGLDLSKLAARISRHGCS